MSAMSSQITSLTVVYSSVYSGADQRKHQSYASLAFVLGIHRWPVNSSHKGPVTRKIFRLMTSSWEVEMCATRGFLYYWWLRLFTVITLYVTLSLTSPKESNAISSSIEWLYYITNSSASGRDHFGWGLGQWEATLQCNVASHRLNPYLEWSLSS